MYQYSQHSRSPGADASVTKRESITQARTADVRLPVLSPQDVAALNLWYGRCPSLVFDGLEQLLKLTPMVSPRDTAKGALATLPLTIGGEPAQAVLPYELAASLIETCGADYFSLSPLSVSLLLEYRLSEVLGRIEAFLGERVSLDTPAPFQKAPSLGGAVRLDALCEYGQEKYWVTFLIPQHLAASFTERLAGTSPQREKAAVDSVPVNLTVRAGYTSLTFKELRGIGLNDVLLMNCPLPKSEVMAVLGERYAARARWEDGKVILLESPSQFVEGQKKVWTMQDGLDKNTPIEALDGGFDDVLVHVTFEIGRREIELRELRGLTEGYVFDCGRDPRVGVDILAGNRRVGQGELILINDTLGVRVTRLFNHE